MINIFIGYDSKEKVAYNVLSHSIIQNSTKPVVITPIALNHLKDDFVRERNALSFLGVVDIKYTRYIDRMEC